MEEDLVYVCLKQSSWNKGFNHDMLWQVNRRHMNFIHLCDVSSCLIYCHMAVDICYVKTN